MTEIKSIGHLLSLDDQGNLLNDAHIDKIKSPWRDLVDAVQGACVEYFNQRLHSLYVRGSVANGTAELHIADLDCYCVLVDLATEADKAWKKDIRHKLAKQYPFCTKVELVFIPFERLLKSSEFEFERFVIRTQSACVWGEDLASQFGPYKVNEAIAFRSKVIKPDIDGTIETLLGTNAPERIKVKCRWIMKRILRTGLELTFDQEHLYSRDLYVCYQIFSRKYPGQEPHMKRALDLAINPTSEAGVVIQFLRQFGSWLVSEVENKK